MNYGLEESFETKIIATQVYTHIQTYKNYTDKHIHQKKYTHSKYTETILQLKLN